MVKKSSYCLVLEPAPGRPWCSLHRCKFSLTDRLEQDGLIGTVFAKGWSDHQLSTAGNVEWVNYQNYMHQLSCQYPDVRFCLYVRTGRSYHVEYFAGGLYSEETGHKGELYPAFDAASLHTIGG